MFRLDSNIKSTQLLISYVGTPAGPRCCGHLHQGRVLVVSYSLCNLD